MDDKDVVIAQLLQEIAHLCEEVRLLKQEVARFKKDPCSSSKPPSNDMPLDAWNILHQVALPKKMSRVIEYKVRKYLDPATGKTYVAALPDEIIKVGLLSADMTAFVSYLKGVCHMSYATIQQFFKPVMKLELSHGMLCKAVQKVSDDELACRLPNESQGNVDETGHHADGKQALYHSIQTPIPKSDPTLGLDTPIRFSSKNFSGGVRIDLNKVDLRPVRYIPSKNRLDSFL
jgi:hypothetical protein